MISIFQQKWFITNFLIALIYSGPLLHEAAVTGVHILPYHCRLNPHTATVELLGRLPFIDLHTDGTDKKESDVKEMKKQLSDKKRKTRKDEIVSGVSSITDMTIDDVTSSNRDSTV